MMTELMPDTCKYGQYLCWLPADNVIPCVVTSMLLVRQNSKAQDRVTKTIRDPFRIQFTHIPRGGTARVAATFHHTNA